MQAPPRQQKSGAPAKGRGPQQDSGVPPQAYPPPPYYPYGYPPQPYYGHPPPGPHYPPNDEAAQPDEEQDGDEEASESVSVKITWPSKTKAPFADLVRADAEGLISEYRAGTRVVQHLQEVHDSILGGEAKEREGARRQDNERRKRGSVHGCTRSKRATG